MVRLSAVSSLLALLSPAFCYEYRDDADNKYLPGAYTFEFNDQDRSEFYNQVAANGITRMKLNYTLFQGASIQLHNLADAKRIANDLANLPVVKGMWPVKMRQSAKPHVEWQGTVGQSYTLYNEKRGRKSDEFPPHVMTQVDKLRGEGYTGQGIKIAVVDSGIDYNHPALGGCFGPNCLVSFGADLVGDDYTGTNDPTPDDDPMDCVGHGTHVAGIIAAQENQYGFTGAAPGVELGSYRVFGCDGTSADDVIMAGFNQAYDAGADIITASLGESRGWSQDVLSVAVSRIVEKGVPCTVAIGNGGEDGIFNAGSPSDGFGVTSIASFDNVEFFALVNVSSYSINGSGKFSFGASRASPDGWKGVKLPLWVPGDDFGNGSSCEPFTDAPDLRGVIALLNKGECSQLELAQFAVAAGAEYIMSYGPSPEIITSKMPEVDGLKAFATISPETGARWIDLMKNGSIIIVDMENGSTDSMTINTFPNSVTGGSVSSFSSWGPNWDMISKPQFGAPGSSILSTYPLSMGGYAVLRGTSMACPLAAAIYALIAQVRGTFELALIENLIASTASPRVFNNGTAYSKFLAPVPQQGAGLIQAHKAAYAEVLLTPSGLSFNDTDNAPESLNFTVINTSSKDFELEISHVPALTVYTYKNTALGGTFPNERTVEHATLKFSDTTITVDSGKNMTIEVRPTPPKGLDTKKLPVWSGFIELRTKNNTLLSLPYVGLSGSLHNATVLEPNAGLIIDTSNKESPVVIPANTTFILPNPKKIYDENNVADLDDLKVTHYLTLGSPEVTADVVPMAIPGLNSTVSRSGNSSIGQVAGFPMLSRPAGIKSGVWVGELSGGSFVPAGLYKIVYRALKIYGDREKESDWDKAESQVFRIEYDP
ncbi:hypothetical protein V2G26_007363 [Clonostachys chloroleuca]|uniref:Uncharacterized protein n=2 Tax=Clonostachys TaxID=110564 RepID=A0AA35M741_9HYPO|nr:unnamed protein product [Clonostachys chloroleuca]